MNIIKLDDERVRRILIAALATDRLFEVEPDVLAALAQAVLDLRTANAMLEAALEASL